MACTGGGEVGNIDVQMVAKIIEKGLVRTN